MASALQRFLFLILCLMILGFRSTHSQSFEFSTPRHEWALSGRKPIDYFAPSDSHAFRSLPRAQEAECRFSYDDSREDGPSHWGTACPDGSWAVCGTGQFQSPIDIETRFVIERNVTLNETDSDPSIRYGEVRISHFGFSYDQGNHPQEAHLLFDEEDDPYIIVKPTLGQEAPNTVQFTESWFNSSEHFTLNLTQLHFHVPGENRIDGKQFPMEVHLVHKDANSVAVVGILFDIDDRAPNPFLNEIIEALDKRNETTPETSISLNVTISDILPSESAGGNHSFFHFMGSLSTPPCTEGIRWFVLHKTASLSTSQLQRFSEIASGNARPPQPVKSIRPITLVRFVSKPQHPEDDDHFWFFTEDFLRLMGFIIAGVTVLGVAGSFLITVGYYLRVGSREGWGGWRPIPTHSGTLTPDATAGPGETFMLVDTDEEGGVEMHEMNTSERNSIDVEMGGQQQQQQQQQQVPPSKTEEPTTSATPRQTNV